MIGLRRVMLSLVIAAALPLPCDSQVAPVVGATITQLPPADHETIVVQLTITVPPGWYIGASNPGAWGLPTRVTWKLPKGLTLSKVQWPPPDERISGTDTLLVYERSIPLGATFRVGPRESVKPLKATITYGVCRNICIPGQIEATLPAPVTGGEGGSSDQHRAVPGRLPDALTTTSRRR